MNEFVEQKSAKRPVIIRSGALVVRVGKNHVAFVSKYTGRINKVFRVKPGYFKRSAFNFFS